MKQGEQGHGFYILMEVMSDNEKRKKMNKKIYHFTKQQIQTKTKNQKDILS